MKRLRSPISQRMDSLISQAHLCSACELIKAAQFHVQSGHSEKELPDCGNGSRPGNMTHFPPNAWLAPAQGQSDWF